MKSFIKMWFTISLQALCTPILVRFILISEFERIFFADWKCLLLINKCLLSFIATNQIFTLNKFVNRIIINYFVPLLAPTFNISQFLSKWRLKQMLNCYFVGFRLKDNKCLRIQVKKMKEQKARNCVLGICFCFGIWCKIVIGK